MSKDKKYKLINGFISFYEGEILSSYDIEIFHNSPYPVFKTIYGWCFWNETWSDFCGPFKIENECRSKFKEYCKLL